MKNTITQRHKRTGDDRCNMLSRIAGQMLSLQIPAHLRQAEAPKTREKFASFMKSLDGAIRHAQRQRGQEERAALAAEMEEDDKTEDEWEICDCGRNWRECTARDYDNEEEAVHANR